MVLGFAAEVSAGAQKETGSNNKRKNMEKDTKGPRGKRTSRK